MGPNIPSHIYWSADDTLQTTWHRFMILDSGKLRLFLWKGGWQKKVFEWTAVEMEDGVRVNNKYDVFLVYVDPRNFLNIVSSSGLWGTANWSTLWQTHPNTWCGYDCPLPCPKWSTPWWMALTRPAPYLGILANYQRQARHTMPIIILVRIRLWLCLREGRVWFYEWGILPQCTCLTFASIADEMAGISRTSRWISLMRSSSPKYAFYQPWKDSISQCFRLVYLTN